MVGMASNSISEYEYFSIGTKISCKTLLNEDIIGYVIAFDHVMKVILLRQPSRSGQSKLNNIALLNLDYVSDVKVLNECTDEAPELRPLSHCHLKKRLDQAVLTRLNMAHAMSMGVSDIGLCVYSFIVKTIEQCYWNNQNIVVMDEVLITPPYRSENCLPKDGKDAKALDHVKKILDKYHNEHVLSFN